MAVPSHAFNPCAGVEIIKLLYEYGADLDFKTSKDWTPLSYAKVRCLSVNRNES